MDAIMPSIVPGASKSLKDTGKMLANGELAMVVEGVETLSIHGSVYYDVVFRLEGAQAPQKIRVNPEAFYVNPKPGDRVLVEMVLGNIMSAKKQA